MFIVDHKRKHYLSINALSARVFFVFFWFCFICTRNLNCVSERDVVRILPLLIVTSKQIEIDIYMPKGAKCRVALHQHPLTHTHVYMGVCIAIF